MWSCIYVNCVAEVTKNDRYYNQILSSGADFSPDDIICLENNGSKLINV